MSFPQSLVNGTEKLLGQANAWIDHHPDEAQVILVLTLVAAILVLVAMILYTVLFVICSCFVAWKMAHWTEAATPPAGIPTRHKAEGIE